MTKVAVTGAWGFIGSHLIRELQAAGHVACAVPRPADENETWRTPPDAEVLVHLAGRAHVLREEAADPRRAFLESNLGLTQAVFRAAASAGVGRFIYMSSAGVLGSSSPPGGLTDDTPAHPHDAYSQSKWAAECWLREQAAACMETVIVRPPLVYGPGARGNFARILRAVRAGWPLPTGALRAPRSMVGIRNLCDMLIEACLQPGAANATFLVADSETVCIAELADLMAEFIGRRRRSLYVPVPVLVGILRMTGRQRDIPRVTQPFVLHPTRVAETLGWQAPFSLLDELRWTVQQEAKSE
jgi:UDP-glucose 4-epimerase